MSERMRGEKEILDVYGFIAQQIALYQKQFQYEKIHYTGN
jgi:hypothetical protein